MISFLTLLNISKMITNESRKKSRENTVLVWYIYMKKSKVYLMLRKVIYWKYTSDPNRLYYMHIRHDFHQTWKIKSMFRTTFVSWVTLSPRQCYLLKLLIHRVLWAIPYRSKQCNHFFIFEIQDTSIFLELVCPYKFDCLLFDDFSRASMSKGVGLTY